MARGQQTGGSGIIKGSNNKLADVTISWDGAKTFDVVPLPLGGYYGGPILVWVVTGAIGAITLNMTAEDNTELSTWVTREKTDNSAADPYVSGIPPSQSFVYGPIDKAVPSFLQSRLRFSSSGAAPSNGTTTRVVVWEA